MKYFKIIVFSIIGILNNINSTSSKVTKKQYASMPDLFHFDDYDKCMLHGKKALYCSITIQLYPINSYNTSETWKIIQEISSDPDNYRHDLLRHGVCVPEILDEELSKSDNLNEQLSEFYSKKFIHKGITGKINLIKCETNDAKPVDIYDILFAVFIALYIALVLFASVYEGSARYKSKHDYEQIINTSFGKFISAFSIPRNWYRLKNVNLDSPDVQALRCMQGIRFYNMIIVIIGHTIAMNLAIPVSNPIFVETLKDNLNFVFLGIGKYVIQTFLMMSNWLLTYHFFVALEKEAKIKPLYLVLAIIHRYIRLTPTLAIMIGIHSTWLVRLSRGPFWDQIVGEEYRSCRENWWTNLLYINNYVNRKRMCFPQTWYLAVDFQLYVLSLLLLWLMWNYRNKIIYILSAVLLLHILVSFIIAYDNNWDSSTLQSPEIYYNRKVIQQDQWHITYASPYSNLAGLVAGLAFGYIFYKYKNERLFTTKIHVVTWWIVIWISTLGVILLPIFIPPRTLLFSAVYNSINRSIFIFGIGLGVLGGTQGLGWMMKWICEWPPTYVLGRLTYSAYLVHIFFQRVQIGTKRSPNYLAGHLMYAEAIGNVAMGYIGAFLLTLLIEMPVSELQKRLIPKHTARKSNRSKAR